MLNSYSNLQPVLLFASPLERVSNSLQTAYGNETGAYEL